MFLPEQLSILSIEGFCLKSREPCLEKVSTLRDSVGCALMASKFPGIPIGEINLTLSRTVLTSSKNNF